VGTGGVAAELSHLGADKAIVICQLAQMFLHFVNSHDLIVPGLGVIREGDVPPEIPDAAFGTRDYLTLMAMFCSTTQVNYDFKTRRNIFVREKCSNHFTTSLAGISRTNSL